jgi:hypothetical protein
MRAIEKRDVPSTDRQQLFCENFVANGGNGAQAAKGAGYSQHPGSSRVTAYRLLQQPKIRARIHSLTSEWLALDAVIGRKVLFDLAQNAKSERVRLLAAKDLLNRAGIFALDVPDFKSDVDDISEEELCEKIYSLLNELKLVDQGTGPFS